MPWITIGITITCFTILSVFYKLSERKNCNTVSFSAWLFTAAALTSLATLLKHDQVVMDRAISPWLLLMAVSSGVCAITCIGCLIKALRTGSSLSVANIFLNVSILIPILFSLFFLGEEPSLTTVLGILCFIVFVYLLNTGYTPVQEGAQ